MFENLTKLRNEQPAAFWALIVLFVVVIAGGIWSRSAISNANAQRIAAEQGKRSAVAAVKKALAEKGAVEAALQKAVADKRKAEEALQKAVAKPPVPKAPKAE